MLLPSIVGLLLQVALAPPDVRERVEYYDVAGSSAQEIRHSIDRLRPKADDGERFDAFTRWEVRWDYRYELGESGCAISEFTTSVRIVMTLPRWSPGLAGSELKKHWEKYYRALVDHERGHADIAVQAAEDIQEQASALPPVSTCLALETAVDGRAEEILERHRRKEIAYDARTRHGTARGAVFP
jgi:predicted secreted Zn-dependent protease